MTSFCPLTAPVVTPSFSWGATSPSMSFDADIFYLAHLWEIARTQREDCPRDEEQHLDWPQKPAEKGHTRDLGKLLRHAATKTIRYAQRGSHRHHRDNTYIVLHSLAEYDDFEGNCANQGLAPDLGPSTSFRSSLSLKADRMMFRKRR